MVRVPKISDRTDAEPYPNRKLSGIQFRVSNNFGSGNWLPNCSCSALKVIPRLPALLALVRSNTLQQANDDLKNHNTAYEFEAKNGHDEVN